MTGIGEVSDRRLDEPECCMPPADEGEGDEGEGDEEGDEGEKEEDEWAIGDGITSESGARGSEADVCCCCC